MLSNLLHHDYFQCLHDYSNVYSSDLKNVRKIQYTLYKFQALHSALEWHLLATAKSSSTDLERFRAWARSRFPAFVRRPDLRLSIRHWASGHPHDVAGVRSVTDADKWTRAVSIAPRRKRIVRRPRNMRLESL